MVNLFYSLSSVTQSYVYKLTKSELNQFTCYIDNIQKITGSTSPSRSYANYPLYLFQDARGSATFGEQKLYYAKYTINGTLVRNYVPIVFNGTYALYDKCLSGNVIYTNAGTGSFTGGGTQSVLTYTHTYTPSVNISDGTTWSIGTPYVYDTEWLQGEKLYVYTSSGWTEKIIINYK